MNSVRAKSSKGHGSLSKDMSVAEAEVAPALPIDAAAVRTQLVAMTVTLMGGFTLEFTSTGAPQIHRDGPGKVSWSALSSAGSTVVANISMTLGMDGFMEAEIAA